MPKKTSKQIAIVKKLRLLGVTDQQLRIEGLLGVEKNSEKTKSEIKLFYLKNNYLPKKLSEKTEEARLAIRMSDYISPSKKTYDEIFRNWCLDRGLRKFWTKESCLASALKCKTKAEWIKNFSGANDFAKTLEPSFYQKCVSHFKIIQKQYSDSELLNISKKYESVTDWINDDPNSQRVAYRRKALYARCKSYMKALNHQWTKEECAELAKKYTKKSSFQQFERKAYQSATNHGWIEEICSHMKPEWGKWNNESNLILEASKYKSVSDWVKKSSGSYNAAQRLGLLNKIKTKVFKKNILFICLENLTIYDSKKSACVALKINPGNLHKVLTKKRISTGGYTFRYLTPEEVFKYEKDGKL